MADQKHRIKLSVEGAAKLDGMRREVQGTFARLDSAALKLTGVIGTLAGVGGIGLLIDKNVEAARSARSWADALGVPIERLTAIQSASRTVGIDADKMADILKDSAEKIGDAYRNGGGEAVEVLDSLGLSVDRLNALSPDQQLFAIAGALQQVGTQGEKVQIMESLASDASKLLPLLDDNAAKLRELMQAADDSGRTLTRIEADKLMQAGEATDRLNEAMQGLGQTLTLSIVGPITDVIEFATKAVGRVQTLGQQFANFVVGEGEVNTRLLEEEEKLTRLQIKQRMVRGETAKAAAREEVEAQQLVVENARRVDAELRERREKWLEGFNAPIVVTPGGAGGGGGGFQQDQAAADLERVRQGLLSEEEALRESYENRAWIVDDAFANELIRFEERNQMLTDLHLQYEQGLTDISTREGQQRARAEQGVNNQIAGMRQSAAGLAVGLLRTLGQDHKEWAYASILIEKGLNIALAIQNTAVAVTRAMAVDPTGALAARAQAIGNIQVGLIAATGIAEAAGASGGGGLSGGGGVTPVQSVDPGGAVPLLPAADQRQGATINVYIDGPALGDDRVREVVIEAVQTGLANDEFQIF